MENELTNEQFTAIRRSIDLGKALIKDHPEILDLYREGNYLSTISEELDIQSRYGVTDNVAMFGVHHAIAGHNGSFNLDSYVGLIPDEDGRKRLGRKQRQENGREVYEKKVGIHGRTAEQMSGHGREGGLKGGREVGLKGAIARGQTPWVMGRIPEVEYAHALSFLSEYGKGSQAKNQLIALELNREYHDCKEVRTVKAVTIKLYKYRKSLEDKI